MPPEHLLTCPDDGTPADLVQPDPIRPLRLLAVCPTCGSWRVLAARDQTPRDWAQVAASFRRRTPIHGTTRPNGPDDQPNIAPANEIG